MAGVWMNVLYVWFVEILKIIFLLKMLRFNKNNISSKYIFKLDGVSSGHKNSIFSSFMGEFYKRKMFGKIYINKFNEVKSINIPYFWGHLRIFKKFMFGAFIVYVGL